MAASFLSDFETQAQERRNTLLRDHACHGGYRGSARRRIPDMVNIVQDIAILPMSWHSSRRWERSGRLTQTVAVLQRAV